VAYERIEHLERSRAFRILALGAYIAICLLPLVVPELRLSLLLHPPTPDLFGAFNRGVQVNTSLSLRLIGYAGFLIWPFYLLAMYSLRRRYIALFIFTAIPSYCGYCASGYMGRSEMLLVLGLCAGVIWLDRPAIRLRVTIVALICIPFLLVFFEMYSNSRIGAGGASANDVSATERIERVLSVETSFPSNWERVVSSGRHANLWAYATWLVTLPIPKLITGEIAGSRMNTDITELISHVTLGSTEYSVILTGTVVESVYIYGMWFFWIHAAMAGCLAGLVCGFMGGSRALLFALVSLAFTMGYIFMRAGISGALPPIVNSYLSLYCWMFVLMSRPGGASRRQAVRHIERSPVGRR
jgi:hypothetical protein